MILPPKISMKQEGHVFYNTMPCIIPQYNIAGVKVVSRYPGRTPSLDSQILLYDLKAGKLKALIDGNYITAMRTGAVAAHSIELLSIDNYKTIGMIGLGSTARATCRVLLENNPDKKILIKLYRYKDHAEAFIDKFAKYTNVTFRICSTYEEVVTDSDVVVSSVTYAEKNFCEDKCFKPGCLVVPIHTLGFQNCDLFFDKVYADDIEHVRGFKYFDKFRRFAEIADVITGNAVGRENDQERIIVYNIGIALHDIFFAEKVYQLLDDVDEAKVDFEPPKEKFWL